MCPDSFTVGRKGGGKVRIEEVEVTERKGARHGCLKAVTGFVSFIRWSELSVVDVV